MVPLDLGAGAAGGFNPLIPIGFEAGKALLGLFGGNEDPEEIYQRRLNEALKYINQYFGKEENLIRSRGDRDLAIARQSGARQAAAVGYTGDVGSFTAPQESSIGQRIQDAIESLQATKSREITQLHVGSLNLPVYQKPNFFDYASAAAGAAGNIYSTYQQNQDLMRSNKDYYDTLFKTMSDTFGAGRTSAEGSINRNLPSENSFRSPVEGSGVGSDRDYASIYFSRGRKGIEDILGQINQGLPQSQLSY